MSTPTLVSLTNHLIWFVKSDIPSERDLWTNRYFINSRSTGYKQKECYRSSSNIHFSLHYFIKQHSVLYNSTYSTSICLAYYIFPTTIWGCIQKSKKLTFDPDKNIMRLWFQLHWLKWNNNSNIDSNILSLYSKNWTKEQLYLNV